jgi:Trypsin-like peptidase domain
MASAMNVSRTALICGALIASLAPNRAVAADDAAAAYRKIEPSLVKVWAHSASGAPLRSGTGFVVASNVDERWSLIVTAAHVIADADKVTVDIDRRSHDEPTTVVSKSDTPDIALLRIERGDLRPVRFAPASRVIRPGFLVAVAGFFQNDEQIGVTGQAPRLRYPGTVSSLPDNGRYIELNINVEEGLSGAPVFDPAQGDVIGMVQQRSHQGEGGYALPLAHGLLAFLEKQHVAIAVETPAPAATQRAAPMVAVQPAAPMPVPALDRSPYSRVLDGLHSQDLATQLAALDEAAHSKDLALRRTAIKTALSSQQESVRAAALQLAMSSASRFSVEIQRMTEACLYSGCTAGLSTELTTSIAGVRSFTVHMRHADGGAGSFESYTDYSKGARNDHPLVVSGGSVDGDSVTFGAFFDLRPVTPYYGGVGGYEYQFTCNGTAHLLDGGTLRGTMGCHGGPLSATYDITLHIAN